MNKPHGGTIIDLRVANPDSVDENMPAIILSRRSEADLEMLATGSMSPLRGFMGLRDYRSVLNDMKLASGLIWPLPVVLPLNDDEVNEALQRLSEKDENLKLRDMARKALNPRERFDAS